VADVAITDDALNHTIIIVAFHQTSKKKINNNKYSIRNPEDPSQMARMLANEARERWDLFNEINRTKKKLSLEGLDEVRKKSSL
jgi:hypothetical protein